MKWRMRPETALTNEQANIIIEVLNWHLRELRIERNEKNKNECDYFKMINDGIKSQSDGKHKIYTDEAKEIAEVIHKYKPTSNDAAYKAVESYLRSQEVNN